MEPGLAEVLEMHRCLEQETGKEKGLSKGGWATERARG